MIVTYPKCFGVSLLTNEARHFSASNSHLAARHLVGPAEVRLKWMVLGRFDHLALHLSDRRTAMVDYEYELTDDDPNRRVSYYGHLSYYGEFIYPQDFDWREAYEQFGLAGFCTIRVRQGGRACSPTEDRRAGEAIERQLRTFTHLRWVLGTTTGWDDYVVFLFSNSYHTILQAIWKIRGVSETPSAAEWLLTSCTLPLVRFDWSDACEGMLPSAVEARSNLIRNLDRITLPKEQIGWAVRFAVQPGRLHDLRGKVTEAAREQNLDLVVTKLFGQADFRCAGGANSTTHHDLVRFLAHVAFPLVTEPDTAIRNIETHLHLDAPEPTRDSVPPLPRSGVPTDRPRHEGTAQLDSGVVALLQKGGIPRSTLNALRSVFSRIELLQNTELLAGEFDSLVELRSQFNHSAERLQSSTLLRPPYLHEVVSDWLTGLERCLADRYRGIYPTGESITMRMATYHASHQKFLRVADRLIAEASTLALKSIETQRRSLGLAPRPNLPKLTAVAHLGNSPTGLCACNVRLFGTSFIELPVSEVFNFGRSEVLLHETGHHIAKACLVDGVIRIETIIADSERCDGENGSVPPSVQNIPRKYLASVAALKLIDLNRQLYEILAELFACSIGFAGDAGAQWQVRSSLLAELFSGGSDSNLNRNDPVYLRTEFTYELRNAVVSLLFAELRRADATVYERAERCISALRERFSERSRKSGHESIFEDVCGVFLALLVLMELPEFDAFIRGLSPDAVNLRIAECPILATYRRLLQKPNGSLVESLDALREAWSIITAKDEPVN